MKGITDLPYEVLIQVAGFLSPPEVLNFTAAYPHKDEPLLDTTSVTWFANSNSLQQTLLFESQYRGLIDVLHQGSPKLSHDEIRTIFSLQKELQTYDDCLHLSGSTMVQAMTGLRFENSDVDFYVNPWGIKAVRQTLRSLGFVCHNLLYSYHGFSFHTSPNGIHHVETYVRSNKGSPQAIDTITAFQVKKRWMKATSVRTGARRPRRQHAAPQRAGQEGPTAQTMSRGMALNCLKGSYKFQPHFPFSKNPHEDHKKTFDIVVTSFGTDPQDVINNFDLDICKCTWTGTAFLNPNGDKTYCKQTGWNTEWGTLVNNYLPSYIPQIDLRPQPSIPLRALDQDCFTNWTHGKLVWVIHALCQAIHKQEGRIPCIRHGFTCSCSSHAFNNQYYIKLHKTILKRFRRMHKYASRGIEMPLANNIIAAFFPIRTPSTYPSKRPRLT